MVDVSSPRPIVAAKAGSRRSDFSGSQRRVAPTQTVGHGGVAIYGGYIVDKDKNSELTGTRKYTTYSQLLANVGIVAASTRLLLNMIGRATWEVEPAKDSGARGEEIADLVEEILNDMTTPWYRVVRSAATYVLFGFSWQEWTAKRRDDGVVGFLDVEVRPQSTIERWDCDETGTVFGVGQRSPQTQQELYLPRAKAVYIVDDTLSSSPEGLGILRHVAPAAKRLQRYEQLEGMGFETDLRGVPVGRAPYAQLQALVNKGELTPTQKDDAVAVIESFIEDHVRSESTGIVLDSQPYVGTTADGTQPSATHQWGLELLKSGNTTQEEVAEAINRVVRDIARMFGTEGLLLGESGSGSLAMSKDKSARHGLIVDGTLIELSYVFEQDLLDPLFALNGWDPKLKPTLTPQKLQNRDVREIAEALESLSRAGAQIDPTDPAVNAVRRILGLPEIDVDALLEENDVARAGRNMPGDEDDPDSEAVDDPDAEATPDDDPGSADPQE